MTPQFSLTVNKEGALIGQKVMNIKPLVPDCWYKLQFDWDIDKKQCNIYLDGQFCGSIPLENETPNGLSYVRFESAADRNTEDRNGFYIRSVNVRVQNTSDK